MPPLVAVLIVCAALAVVYLSLVKAPTMRPKVTPGILAEVTMILGENEQISIWHSKLPPEINPNMVYGALLDRWIAMLPNLGVRLDFTTYDGQVIPFVRALPTDSVTVAKDEPDDAV